MRPMEISRMRDLGPKRFGFWGRLLFNLKLGLRIGLPALTLMTLAGCASGKRYLTLPAEKAGSWESIARELCPTDLNLSQRLKELNFNELLPPNADTRWYSKLASDVRIAIPEISCTVPAPVTVMPPAPIPVPLPNPIPSPIPTPPHPVAPIGEQKDVVESHPDVAPAPQLDVTPPPPDATKVKPEGGHRPPRHDAHTGGGSDAQTTPPPVIPQ